MGANRDQVFTCANRVPGVYPRLSLSCHNSPHGRLCPHFMNPRPEALKRYRTHTASRPAREAGTQAPRMRHVAQMINCANHERDPRRPLTDVTPPELSDAESISIPIPPDSVGQCPRGRGVPPLIAITPPGYFHPSSKFRRREACGLLPSFTPSAQQNDG